MQVLGSGCYRTQPEPPPAPPWPVSKEQLGFIMQCSSETLNDALINDLARCVADCEMDTLELVYFLGQCGHESCGLRYPVEIHDGSNYEGAATLATQSQVMASGLLAPVGSKSRAATTINRLPMPLVTQRSWS